MKPFQIWLPLFNISWETPSFSRDVERAQRSWDGEDRIWLIPGLKEVKRWSIKEGLSTFNECAIPSETFNNITIVNVSKNRTFFPQEGNGIPGEWGGNFPENLLNLWVSSNPTFISIDNKFKMNIPFFINDKVAYKEVIRTMPPGPIIPITKVDKEDLLVELKWTPNNNIESISPEVESSEFFGKYKWEKEPKNTFNLAVNDGGKKAFHTAILWKQPIQEMFPLGGGIDLLNHNSYLRRCLKDKQKNKVNIALQASRLTTVGWTTLEKQMVFPALYSGCMKNLLFEIEGSFDIEVNSFEELTEHELYTETFHSRIEVTRIFGWEGYFWWQLNNLVNVENKSIKTCELCEGMISGKIDKRYCSKKENPDCFRKRKAANKRNERKK
ncbi:hypothetical protein BKP45_21070 [Anaerobacillus alkalidiazotrophicus]|uniref:Uncharacterized protein n=1 Tax=Anaerobacillus alkalidiazotrophicus TaxID=472963 RepID=A0A1S2LVE8_9BACI|nr:hypothetical protein [Anaerobacillus alkalidiazotrophicus]OIJ16501.1 hypothetical protein BKP45_21070 [Anaerobacillus alkalidiazotrophicus]